MSTTTTTTTTRTTLTGVPAPAPPSSTGNDLNIYDEIEIEDMTYDAALQIYHYPCPCGDRFEIAVADLRDGQDVAVCPSCSLMIRVIFDAQDLPPAEGEEGAGPGAG